MVLAARIRALEIRYGSQVAMGSAVPRSYDEISEWVEKEFAGRRSFNSAHGTHRPVEEPSTASIADSCAAAKRIAIRSPRRPALLAFLELPS
jgi:hypothetical protein